MINKNFAQNRFSLVMIYRCVALQIKFFLPNIPPTKVAYVWCEVCLSFIIFHFPTVVFNKTFLNLSMSRLSKFHG